jgi:hypothetical protein
MIYNELFESIIRTSGQDTEDVFAEYDNFWAPVPVIERMFEQVLKETSNEYYGLFSKKNYNIKATIINTNINIVLSHLAKNNNSRETHEVLPCNKDGSAAFYSEEELKICRVNMFKALDNYYKNLDAYTKQLGNLYTYISQNIDLEYKQGKTTPLNAINKKIINGENQEEV